MPKNIQNPGFAEGDTWWELHDEPSDPAGFEARGRDAAAEDLRSDPNPRESLPFEDRPAGVEKNFIETNGIRLAYEVRGWGEPLVLIMGFAADGQAWDAHAQSYVEKFRCFLVDNRGSGDSDKPEGPYTTAQMADDYAGLIRGLGLGKVHVAGISMGAAIAQQLALRHPDVVRTLVLVGAWPRFDGSPLWALVDVARIRPLMAQHAFDAQMAACLSHDTRETAHKIIAPTLLALTSADIFSSAAAGAEYLHARIPCSELMIFPGCGPVNHWEDVEEFTRMTMEWMEKH